MKIWGDIPKIQQVYEGNRKLGKVDKVSGVASKRDVVSISNNAKDYQTVIKTLRDVPDIREEKINELSQRYEAGNYDVSGKDIADKIVKSTFDKKT